MSKYKYDHAPFETEKLIARTFSKGIGLDGIAQVWGAMPIFSKQVHGTRVVWYPEDFLSDSIEADAIFTSKINCLLVIATADCVPILIHHPKSGVIGVIHAGWRGVASNIVMHALQGLQLRNIPLAECQVWIGPHIGYTSFEVKKDVADQLIIWDSGTYAVRQNASGNFQVSLYALVVNQLRVHGVSEISGGGADTFLMRENYYSYRRGDRNCRNYHGIGVCT
ncbi:MAG: polyphenol oxidase family protein [Methylacidiphilales bacterium]|nr:polyphenol oxidase family protein [Candidatus Methylacidiphilales bacterium]